jgi:Putative Ig domain
VPTLTGFNGRSPQCTLASGSVAPGMTLNADCSITGVPTDFGTYQFVVRIGAQGVSNQLAWSGGYAVFGPSLVYNFSDLLRLGVDIAPITTLNNIFWTATPADIVVYAVNSGALPAGLTIAPSTGTISGTPTALGTYSFKLQVQVTNSGRTATSIKQFPENLNVLQ